MQLSGGLKELQPPLKRATRSWTLMAAFQNQRHLLFLRQILPHISAIFFHCSCVAYPLLNTNSLIGIAWCQELILARSPEGGISAFAINGLNTYCLLMTLPFKCWHIKVEKSHKIVQAAKKKATSKQPTKSSMKLESSHQSSKPVSEYQHSSKVDKLN